MDNKKEKSEAIVDSRESKKVYREDSESIECYKV